MLPAQGPPPIDAQALRAAQEGLRRIDLKTATIEQITEILEPALHGHLVSAAVYAPGFELCRARVAPQPANISELSYPPGGRAGLGRANRAGQSMFYSAFAREIAFAEVRPKGGDTITVSEWRTTAEMEFNHVGFTPEVFARLGSVRTVVSWDSNPVQIPGGEDNRKLQQFFSDVFTQEVPPGDEYRYKTSIAIAERFLKTPPFHGLMYPTIQANANGSNVVLPPAVVDERLRFLRCAFYVVDSADPSDTRIRLLDSADSCRADGQIVWTGRSPPWAAWDRGIARRRFDGSRWISFDAAGRVVNDDGTPVLPVAASRVAQVPSTVTTTTLNPFVDAVLQAPATIREDGNEVE